MSRNSPTPADFALVHDFPIGSLVWQWWGYQHWRPAQVVGHMGPWVKTALDSYPWSGRTYPRRHLLRHRFEGEMPPNPSHIARYTMMPEAPLDMNTACAVASAGGGIVGWYGTEALAAIAAREMAAKSRGSFFLLVPTRCFAVTEPPVVERSVQRGSNA